MAIKVKVNGNIGSDKYLTKLWTPTNELISDEPVSFGGDDRGFNPLELLASSLAACTLATLKSYVSIKKWDVPEIEVEVELERLPKEKKSVFTRVIDFKTNDLTEEQKNRLFQIAERCPVHQMLTGTMEITTELK